MRAGVDRAPSLAEGVREAEPLARRILSTGALILLAALIIVCPIPYGAVLPGGHFLVQLLSFSAAALAFLSRPPGRQIGVAAIPLLALVGIAILGGFQLLPVTMEQMSGLSPVSAKVYQDANEILALFDRAALKPKVSIAPESTQTTILLTLAYVAAFAAAAIVATTRFRRRLLIGALLASSIVHLLIATATSEGLDRLHGPFVNPNHFAGYLEIALGFAFGLIWSELLTGRERADGIRDLGERLEKRAVPLILRGTLWGVIAAGIALSRSRGGILAALIATLLMIMIAPLQRSTRVRRAGFAVVGIILVGLGFVAFTTGEAPLLRFLASDPREIGSDQRVQMWTASVEAWQRSPTVGTGLGTFREAFRRVQPAEVHGLVEQAHNDFLQILVTGGWVGAALAVVAFASMLFFLFRAWLRQTHREESAIALAGIGALVSLILHGIVEFNMSIPAIPATLSAMLGVAWAAANRGK